jgi:hypothetical protein
LDIRGLNKPTRILTGRNAHLLGEQNRTKRNPHPNQQLKTRLIQRIGKITLSPFFFVKKKDGRLRPCQDYRYLNDWTIKNAYLLPLISEIMDKLKGAKYFSKFNIRWGYNNIRIRSGDEWKATFKTNRGLYKPTVMFFGMCNSPATSKP